MADVEKIAAELRDRIEGTTKGEWHAVQMHTTKPDIDRPFVVGPSEIVVGTDGICEPERMNDRSFKEDAANMRYIVAAQPENICALLDELSRLREVERMAKDALETFARAAGYLTDANGWCDTDEIELCYDDGRRLSTIPLSAFRAAARALSAQVEERE